MSVLRVFYNLLLKQSTLSFVLLISYVRINTCHFLIDLLNQYTNPGFWFSVKSQCSLVSNLLNQPIRFLQFPAYSRNRQDKLGPRRFFKDGRKTSSSDWLLYLFSGPEKINIIAICRMCFRLQILGVAHTWWKVLLTKFTTMPKRLLTR